MRIPGLKTLNLVFRKLRSRFGASAYIFGYHRVITAKNDPFSICISPENFAHQMAYLAKEMVPISLSQLVKSVTKGQIPSRAAVVTIDDGYRDVLYNALPILEKYKIPATVFVSTGYFGKLFWWDELAKALDHLDTLPPELDFLLETNHYRQLRSKFSGGTREDRHEILMFIYNALQKTTYGERQALLELMQEQASLSEAQYNSDTVLTEIELARLAASEHIEIGSHTVTHPLLPLLTKDMQMAELVESKSRLEVIVGKPVLGFSFPNGKFSSETIHLLQQSGYEFACSSFPDVVRRGTSRSNLPRLWPNDINKIEFERWVTSWGIG